MIIDFEAFKQNKSDEEKLEQDYLNFFEYVMSYLGVPTDFPKLLQIFYFSMRLLEGTINVFLTLNNCRLIEDKDVLDLKTYLIAWLEDLIKSLKRI